MSDRVCIASDGAVNAHISAEDLLTCCHTCGMGYVFVSVSLFLCIYEIIVDFKNILSLVTLLGLIRLVALLLLPSKTM